MKVTAVFLFTAGGLFLSALPTHAQYYGGSFPQPTMPMGFGGYSPYGGMSGGGSANPYSIMRGRFGGGSYGGSSYGMSPYSSSYTPYAAQPMRSSFASPFTQGRQMIQRNYRSISLRGRSGLYGRPTYSRGIMGVGARYNR